MYKVFKCKASGHWWVPDAKDIINLPLVEEKVFLLFGQENSSFVEREEQGGIYAGAGSTHCCANALVPPAVAKHKNVIVHN